MKKSEKKSENTLRQMKMETKLSKIYGTSKSSSKREVYSEAGLPQETREISNKQPNLPSKGIRKRKKQNSVS